jgi:hypothetical protein
MSVHAVAGLGTLNSPYIRLWIEHDDGSESQIVLTAAEAQDAIAALAYALDPTEPKAVALVAIDAAAIDPEY